MFGHFHDHIHHGRLFQKGDLKYVILEQLKDKPSHGYEISRTLEQRFHGFYTPSAGSVYPILQLLQDMGYVTSAEQDGKRVYTITDAGKAFLTAQKDTTDNIRGRLRWWGGAESREYVRDVKKALDEARAIRHLIGEMAVGKDPQKLSRANEVLTKARSDLQTIAEDVSA